jgi:hypothetical protein
MKIKRVINGTVVFTAQMRRFADTPDSENNIKARLILGLGASREARVTWQSRHLKRGTTRGSYQLHGAADNVGTSAI